MPLQSPGRRLLRCVARRRQCLPVSPMAAACRPMAKRSNRRDGWRAAVTSRSGRVRPSPEFGRTWTCYCRAGRQAKFDSLKVLKRQHRRGDIDSTCGISPTGEAVRAMQARWPSTNICRWAGYAHCHITLSGTGRRRDQWRTRLAELDKRAEDPARAWPLLLSASIGHSAQLRNSAG